VGAPFGVLAQGPLRLSRNRLLEVAQLADADEPKMYAQAREQLPRATLDCVSPSTGLAAFAQARVAPSAAHSV
jgi:hypothetical protein